MRYWRFIKSDLDNLMWKSFTDISFVKDSRGSWRFLPWLLYIWEYGDIVYSSSSQSLWFNGSG